MPTRRAALVLSLAAALLAGAAAPAPVSGTVTTAQPDDMTLGNPKAKIQVIEYASMSCPHCGHFNEEVFAPFKAKYLDTGRAYYTLREMLTPPEQVAAAGWLMARCAGKDHYFKVVDEVFRSQSRWNGETIKPILVEIAKNNGLTEAQFEACLTDPAGLKALNERVERAVEKDGVDFTPTIFVNGRKLDGIPQSLADLDAAIAAAPKPGGR